MSVELQLIDLSALPPAEEFLSPRERTLYNAFRFPKRKTEWAGGRLALKRAAAALLGENNLKNIEVLPRPSGKPELLAGGNPAALAHSITHGNGFAAAAASREYRLLGVDLEKVQPRIAGWAEMFFHPSELTQTGDAFLTLLWTQKEALVKLLGTGLSVNSADVRIINGKAAFYAEALKIYQSLGSPEVVLQTFPAPEGFVLSAAAAK